MISNKRKRTLNFTRLAKIATGAASLVVDPSGTTATVLAATNFTADTKITLNDIFRKWPNSKQAEALTASVANNLQARLEGENLHLPTDAERRKVHKNTLVEMLERTSPTPEELVKLGLTQTTPNEKANQLIDLLLGRLHTRYDNYALTNSFRQWLAPVYEELFLDEKFLTVHSNEISRHTASQMETISLVLADVRSRFGSFENAIAEIQKNVIWNVG